MFRFFIPIVLLAFGAMLFFGYTQPNYAEIASVREDNRKIASSTSFQRSEIELKRGLLESTRKSIDSKDREKLERMLPSFNTFDEAAFLNDLNNIARRRGMIVEGVHLSDIDSVSGETSGEEDAFRGKYKKVSCGFSVSTTYPGFKEFLKDLEKNEQIMDITITTFGSGKTTGESSYQVAIDMYYWIPTTL